MVKYRLLEFRRFEIRCLDAITSLQSVLEFLSQEQPIFSVTSHRVVGSNPIWGSDFFRVLQTFNLSCVCCYIAYCQYNSSYHPPPPASVTSCLNGFWVSWTWVEGGRKIYCSRSSPGQSNLIPRQQRAIAKRYFSVHFTGVMY